MEKKSKKTKAAGRKSEKDKKLEKWHSLYGDESLAGHELASPNLLVARRLSMTQPDTNYTAFSHSKSTNMAQKIKECRSAYYNVGIIGNVIDIMADFALEGLQIAHESEQAERLLIKWANITNLYDTVEEILRNMFRDSNVPIIHYDAVISDESVRQMKRIVSKNNRVKAQDLFFTEPTTNEAPVIPYKFSILDVLKVKKEGFDIFGNPNFYYEFPSDVVKTTFKKKDPVTVQLLEQMRKDLSAEDWQKFKETGRYPLKNLTMLYYKKDSSKAWAIPMLWRIIDDLKFKTTLRSMDISIAESIQNAVQIIKIGDVKEGYSPSRGQFEKITDMLKNPSKSKTIVWDDLISIESDYPDTGKILGGDKYQQVNADILAGLGISEVLIGGPGGNYSNSFLSCRTLLERLETARGKVLKWIKSQLLRVTKALNLRRPPVVKFAHMSLRDEKAEKQLLLELVDRNIISYRTLLEHFGENFDIEIKRMRREDDLRKRIREKQPHTLKKLGKFGPQDRADPNLLESVGVSGIENNNNNNQDQQKEFPSEQGAEGQGGGRPSEGREPGVDGPTNEQKNKRDTKPKGMAKLDKVRAYKAFMKIKNIVTEHVCASRNVNIKNLSENDINEIGDISLEVMARLGNIKNIKRKNIINAVFYRVEAPAKLDRCVKQVYKQLLNRFRKRNDKEPSEKQKDKMRSSAWGICRKQLGI